MAGESTVASKYAYLLTFSTQLLTLKFYLLTWKFYLLTWIFLPAHLEISSAHLTTLPPPPPHPYNLAIHLNNSVVHQFPRCSSQIIGCSDLHLSRNWMSSWSAQIFRKSPWKLSCSLPIDSGSVLYFSYSSQIIVALLWNIVAHLTDLARLPGVFAPSVYYLTSPILRLLFTEKIDLSSQKQLVSARGGSH